MIYELIEYPKCTTCRNAKKWLEENKISYEDRHIVENNPTEKELEIYIKKSGLPIKRFFNTTGMAYREGNLKNKLSNMDDEEKIKLLSTNGMLVKRPLLVGEDFVLVGFKVDEWKDKLLNKNTDEDE
ncbi:arsenate reductase family protein [Oceanirhabdus seepicola]|uniref:Arsenate reductase family protein n=1 Tax=Oceanirhabdus seepicola TaxID=2828781 RepID=A0A9J6P599_9CLOT|nr:arsenate reductase family protein [Oceanirhabdus seepicola]MCM1990965.1 arsenate reductase family protein [Oceanirhabdus seepicola]